jgi:hypothetical protein
MTYLVIALGALLSLCGALAMGAGYPIVQVERGWAAVIAGSTALSCGIVTVALGLILHRLSSLLTLLEKMRALTPSPRELDYVGEGELHADRGRALGPQAPAPQDRGLSTPMASPVSGPRTWPQRPVRSSLASARNALKPRIAAARTWESDYEPQEPSFSSRDSLRGDEEVAELASRPGPATPPGAWAQAGPAGEWPHPASARETLGEIPEADSEQWKEPSTEWQGPDVPVIPGEPETQNESYEISQTDMDSIEAILREELRATPGLRLEGPTNSVESSPEAFGSVGRNAPFSASSENEAAAHTPVHSPEPEPSAVPVISDERLTIVGRYESEGASYVMYSDGSVEARTEHAVFHFKSMAELKSFMETQAQNSRD